MNAKQRVLTALRHQPTDRIPVDFKARPDVTARLVEYMGLPDTEALLEKLGVDFRYVYSPRRYAAFEAKTNGMLNSTSENAGKRYIFFPDGSYETAMGVRYRTSSDGQYDEWLSGPFAGEDEPDVDSFDWPSFDCFESVEEIRKRIEPYKDRYAIIGGLNYPFKTCWQMRGMADFFCDMIADEDFAIALWKRCAAYEQELGLRYIRAGVDIVALYGDIAMQDRLMYSLDTWRTIDKPIFAEMIAAFKRENPDVLVFYHSDGNMEDIIADLIEIGVDIINPIQPECMDVFAIKKKYGENICLHGTVSIQQTLPQGSVEDVRREITETVRVCKEGGGFALCPSNLIQNDAPLENILEIYRSAGSYRQD